MTLRMPGRYHVSADSALLDVDAIHAALTRQHWCLGIPKEIVRRAVDNSLCFGVYERNRQIGFARVITDRATFAYLCDVYILEEFRGHGLAKRLMDCVMAHPDLQGLRRFALVTRDAHGLYARYGFEPLDHPDRWLAVSNRASYGHQSVAAHT
jgi:GNAT superfamily N-acetyltransferase